MQNDASEFHCIPLPASLEVDTYLGLGLPFHWPVAHQSWCCENSCKHTSTANEVASWFRWESHLQDGNSPWQNCEYVQTRYWGTPCCCGCIKQKLMTLPRILVALLVEVARLYRTLRAHGSTNLNTDVCFRITLFGYSVTSTSLSRCSMVWKHCFEFGMSVCDGAGR